MKGELIRKTIEKYVPKTLFKDKMQNFELQHIETELSELERLATIGKATEKAFNQGYDFVYNVDVLGECEIKEMYSTKDLLKWAESEGK